MSWTSHSLSGAGSDGPGSWPLFGLFNLSQFGGIRSFKTSVSGRSKMAPWVKAQHQAWLPELSSESVWSGTEPTLESSSGLHTLCPSNKLYNKRENRKTCCHVKWFSPFPISVWRSRSYFVFDLRQGLTVEPWLAWNFGDQTGHEFTEILLPLSECWD